MVFYYSLLQLFLTSPKIREEAVGSQAKEVYWSRFFLRFSSDTASIAALFFLLTASAEFGFLPGCLFCFLLADFVEHFLAPGVVQCVPVLPDFFEGLFDPFPRFRIPFVTIDLC